MKRLIPFVFALALVGQGCFAPAPEQPQEPEDAMMEGDTTSETMEGDAMMEGDVVTFDVAARNFAFSPNVIRVKQGQKLRVNLKSEAGLHDWMVDEFNASTIRVNAGEEAVLEFTPDQVGTFEFYCSVGQHRANGMVGTLIVEPADAMEEDGDAMEEDGDAMEVDAMIDTGVEVEL